MSFTGAIRTSDTISGRPASPSAGRPRAWLWRMAGRPCPTRRCNDPAFGTPPETNRDGPCESGSRCFTWRRRRPASRSRAATRSCCLGTQWNYSDGGPNWLADCLTRRYKRDLQELLFERVFSPTASNGPIFNGGPTPIGPASWRGAPREFGAGVHANVEALARIGLLVDLRKGRWDERQILPACSSSRPHARPMRSVACP